MTMSKRKMKTENSGGTRRKAYCSFLAAAACTEFSFFLLSGLTYLLLSFLSGSIVSIACVRLKRFERVHVYLKQRKEILRAERGDRLQVPRWVDMKQPSFQSIVTPWLPLCGVITITHWYIGQHRSQIKIRNVRAI